MTIAEARRPFDLERGPLLRARLIRLGLEEHLLLVTMHHIVSDGWSIGIIIRELMEAYSRLQSEAPLELAPLPVPYADYAIWQKAWLGQAAFDDQLSYWTERLAGVTALELPTDDPRPPVTDGAA